MADLDSVFAIIETHALDYWRNRDDVLLQKDKRPTAPSDRESQFRVLLHEQTEPNANSHHGINLLFNFMPLPYSPCVLSRDQLENIKVQDLKLESHHEGFCINLRIILEPYRSSSKIAFITIAEDADNAIILELYNQNWNGAKTDSLREGTICTIKHPYFLQNSHGQQVIRVDHVTDIEIMEKEGSSGEGDESVNELLMKGIAAAKGLDHQQAIMFFNRGLWKLGSLQTTTVAWTKIYRAISHLALEQHDLALQDIREPLAELADRDFAASDLTYFQLKTICQVLREMGGYDDLLETAQILERLYPHDITAREQIQFAKIRTQERDFGNYDFYDMQFKILQAKEAVIFDCATYVGNIEVKPSTARGNGIFATKDIAVGELILCEKAFAFSCREDDPQQGMRRTLLCVIANGSVMADCDYERSPLINIIIHKLRHSRSARADFKNLYDGGYKSENSSQVPKNTDVIDSFRILSTININRFEAEQTILRAAPFLNQERAKQHEHEIPQGLWRLASYINHSCIPNCNRAFIGNMIVIRATREIRRGEEMEIQYSSNEFGIPFGKPWGFECQCGLCRERYSEERLRKISELKERSKSEMESSFEACLTVLKEWEECFDSSGAEAGLPRIEVASYCLWLARYGLHNYRHDEAISLVFKGFGLLGFEIAGGKGEEKLEVVRWGYCCIGNPERWTMLSVLLAE